MEKNPTLLLVAAIALINESRKILMQTRPLGKNMAGLWEFPGGKVETGETPEQAVVRELKEELNIEIKVENLSQSCFASEALGQKHLILLLYTAHRWTGDIIPKEGQQYDWYDIDALTQLDMPPADIPLVASLRKILSADNMG